MKQVLVFVSLLVLAACNKPSPKTYVCLNPFTALQGISVDTDHPRVKDTGSNLELTTEDNNVIVIPKNLCAEIRRAAQ